MRGHAGRPPQAPSSHAAPPPGCTHNPRSHSGQPLPSLDQAWPPSFAHVPGTSGLRNICMGWARGPGETPQFPGARTSVGARGHSPHGRWRRWAWSTGLGVVGPGGGGADQASPPPYSTPRLRPSHRALAGLTSVMMKKSSPGSPCTTIFSPSSNCTGSRASATVRRSHFSKDAGGGGHGGSWEAGAVPGPAPLPRQPQSDEALLSHENEQHSKFLCRRHRYLHK